MPAIADPLPDCPPPRRSEIPEESWGGFRDTWYLGRIPPGEAREAVTYEGRLIEILDAATRDQAEFEMLAQALEWAEAENLPGDLQRSFQRAESGGLLRAPDDIDPLRGLEIGVSGLVHALSAIGCVTAASCRGHLERSWSDCPVVFFTAPVSKLEVLAELFRRTGCGLDEARGFVVAEAPSIVEFHSLAELILEGRAQGSDSSGSV